MKNSLKHFSILLFISSLIFCSYLPIFKANLLQWNDRVLITGNETVSSPNSDNIKKIFLQRINNTYIPLTILSFSVEYHFAQDNPFLYHLNNFILHLLVIFLIYLLALRFGLTILSAALAALLFGLHPMHVESVAWIAERKSLLYSLFYLLALVCYERRLFYLRQDKNNFSAKINYFLTHLFGLLSLLANPMALSLPLILLLVDWFKLRKMDRQVFLEKTVFILLIGGLTILTSDFPPLPSNPSQAFMAYTWSFLYYLRQFFFPLVIIPIVRLPIPVSFSNPEYLWSLIISVIAIAGVIRLGKSKWVTFAFLYFLLSIFFLIRYEAVQDPHIVANRFMYLPSLGICMLFGYAIQKAFLWMNTRQRRGAMISLFMAILFIVFLRMGIATYNQANVWKNDVALWTHQLTYFPNDPIALSGLVAALRNYPDFKLSEVEFKKMIKLKLEGYKLHITDDAQQKIKKVNFLISLLERARMVAPDYVDIPYKLGELYQDLGLYANAIEMYRRAIDIDPNYKEIYYRLGLMYLELKENGKAYSAFRQYIILPPILEKKFIEVIDIYNEAYRLDPENIDLRSAIYETLDGYVKFINMNPENADSYYNLGLIYLKMNDLARAKSTFEKVLAINPKHIKALFALGDINLNQKSGNEALDFFTRVIRYDPNHSDALVKIGNIYNQKGSLEKSREYYQKAIEANPKNARAYFNFAYTFETVGQYAEAVRQYKKTVEYDPNNPEVYYNLGNVYLKLEKEEEAIESYRKTVELNPNHLNAWVNLAITSYNHGDRLDAKKSYEEAILLGFDPSADLIRTFEAIH